MLRILIVEDDLQLAATVKYLVEDNPRYRVVAIAEDADSAIAAAEEHEPDLVLLDLHLARGTTGFSVAVRLNDLGVPCLFVSGKAPSFPMPDLALGCLMKPFTAEDVHRSLAMAEDLLRGRETLRPKMPDNLTLYDPHDRRGAAGTGLHPLEAVAPHPPRALDLRPAALGRYSRIIPGRGSRNAQRLRGQRRAGIEQRLAPALDLGAALDLLIRQQRRRSPGGRACARRTPRCAASAPASVSNPA